MRWVPLLAVGLLLSCGAPVVKDRASRPDDAEDVTPKTAVRDAKGVVDEILGALRRGKTDALLPTVVDQLVVLGPGAAHHFSSRSDAVVAMSGYLNDHQDTLEISAGKPVVGVATGGHSVWLVQNLTLGNDAYIVTALTSEKNGIARLAAVFVSPSMPMKKIRKAAKSERLAIPSQTLPTAFKDDPGAAAALAAFNRGVADNSLWEADLMAQSEADKALVIGPAAEQFASGAKALKKYWKKRNDNGVALKLVDKPRSGSTEDGQLAWVTAAVEQTEDNDDPLPLRIFAIYTHDDEGAWRLAALHQAVTTSDDK